MTDEDKTLPPRQPNTPRVWLRRGWAWLRANPAVAWPAAAFVAGVLIGKLL